MVGGGGDAGGLHGPAQASPGLRSEAVFIVGGGEIVKARRWGRFGQSVLRTGGGERMAEQGVCAARRRPPALLAPLQPPGEVHSVGPLCVSALRRLGRLSVGGVGCFRRFNDLLHPMVSVRPELPDESHCPQHAQCDAQARAECQHELAQVDADDHKGDRARGQERPPAQQHRDVRIRTDRSPTPDDAVAGLEPVAGDGAEVGVEGKHADSTMRRNRKNRRCRSFGRSADSAWRYDSTR